MLSKHARDVANICGGLERTINARVSVVRGVWGGGVRLRQAFEQH